MVQSKNNFMRTNRNGLLLFLAVLLVGLFSINAEALSPDTVSSSGVSFNAVAPPVVKPVSKKIITKAAHKQQQTKQTLWAIFLAGMAGGFAALLMPCIFPMLPLTVSYFTKRGGERGSAVSKALLYGLSIMVIYVVLGLLVTIIFGADALNSLSTNGIFNFGFFLLIVAFAASFLGAFEINLPSSWVNKMDQNADKGGMLGLFFMAATCHWCLLAVPGL
jgi:thiol:disulfide interchange protein